METKTLFQIPLENFEGLKARIAELNKRALKLKCEPITFELVRTYTEDVAQRNEETGIVTGFYTQTYNEVRIEGISPKLNGWAFAGTIEHTDAGNILRAVPGQAIPEDFRNVRKQCAHCQKDRNRKDTYIVVSEQNEYRQLGKACVKDYLGHVNPAWIARLAEFSKELEEGSSFGGSGSGPRLAPTREYLEAVCQAVINQNGYVTTKQAYASGLKATSYLAWVQFFALTDEDKKLRFQITQGAREMTSKVLAALEECANSTNSFEQNVYIATRAEHVSYRNAGMVAAAVMIYEKALLKKMNFVKLANSQFIGELKKRDVFTLTLSKIFTFDSQFGTIALYSFLDDQGNVVIWKTGYSEWEGYKFQIGGKYELKGTVVAHEVYKDIKQTKLNRVQILKTLQEPVIVDAMAEA